MQHEALDTQLLRVPFLASAPSKPQRKQKPKPSPAKTAKKKAKAELTPQPVETPAQAETPTSSETVRTDRPHGPFDLILTRLSGVLVRHSANGEAGMDERGPFAKFRDNRITLRVRGNLESIELRKTRYVVGDLTVIARRGKSGRRFICAELTLPAVEVEARLQARFEQKTSSLPTGCVTSFCAPDESIGAVNLYVVEKPSTEAQLLAA